MGIKNIVKKAAAKASSGVAKLSTLSPLELERIQQNREAYLSEMPALDDSVAEEQTKRLLAAGAVEIYNAYLPQLKELYVPIAERSEYDLPFDAGHNIRYLNITKWVSCQEENSLQKLINVYEVLSNEECNIALVFNRERTKTNVYLAVINTNNADNNVDVGSFMDRLKNALQGNFPGSEWKDKTGAGILPCLNNDHTYSVACASNVPAEKSEKFISQTIEKLLDGVVPQNAEQQYTIILLATPVKDIEDRKFRLSDLYSSLAPYASWQTNFNYSEGKTLGSSATVGVNVGASIGSQSGQNQALSNTESTTDSQADTDTISDTHTTGQNESHADTQGSSDSVGISSTVGASGGVNLGIVNAGVESSITGNYNHTWNRGTTDTVGRSVSDAVSKGTSRSLSRAISNAASRTAGTFASSSLGGNFGANFARSSNVSENIGKNEGIVQSFTNYTIKHTLELLEQQMKRLEQSTAMGMWDFAAYVLSEDKDVVSNVAHSYIALTQGEESYLSQAAVNVWRGDLGEESSDAKEICKYLRELRHPLFGLNPEIVHEDASYYVYPPAVTATTILSGKELSYSLNFPRKSVAGFPVFTCAEFGRNIVTYDAKKENQRCIKLGSIYHMHHEENTLVDLSLQSMASHAFVTGSTGSGKSNTIYQLLNEARKQGVHFLVTEPAKGEYKHVFGNSSGVSVYGTNPMLTPLLKINPFSFPKGIHILEHIDRLVEIFNVCWPMYAAMPAVLKEAIERSYEDCGWNLTTSDNAYDQKLYPGFHDVCRNIKAIIDSSEYDSENKGAYKGSLLTRLQSLTNGLYGMIFHEDEIDFETLFDQNVIIDLSRVGSSETKSLLMGILVLKLQEYRMCTADETNSELTHITVLEEAHHLLKRTSAEQTSEGANLLGKSVEMIANAIAEMRTYGEGFIIVDQSPGLLDMAAIRNTNTKIIMRLPDQGDRELVGKAAGLNDDQIMELAKLPLGVAAVYQNEWIQAVLCKVKKAKTIQSDYAYDPPHVTSEHIDHEMRLRIAELLSRCDSIADERRLKEIKERILNLQIESSLKVKLIKWILSPPKEPKMTKMAPLMSALFPEIKHAVKMAYQDAGEPTEWTRSAEKTLYDIIQNDIQTQTRRDIIQAIITDYVFNDLNDIQSLKKWSVEGGLR